LYECTAFSGTSGWEMHPIKVGQAGVGNKFRYSPTGRIRTYRGRADDRSASSVNPGDAAGLCPVLHWGVQSRRGDRSPEVQGSWRIMCRAARQGSAYRGMGGRKGRVEWQRKGGEKRGRHWRGSGWDAWFRGLVTVSGEGRQASRKPSWRGNKINASNKRALRP